MSINLKKRILTSVGLFLSLVLIFKYKIILVYSFIVLGVLSIVEFLNLTKKIFNNKYYKTIINLLFITYVSFFCFIIAYFMNFIELKILIFMIICGCVASDIGGFIIGKYFKGPKLTKVSPNKTISGAIGSLACTCLVIYTLFFYFIGITSFKILLIGLSVSILCQIGDLFFSFLKRKAKVKDTGNIFPGHGGVLDRLDGIFIGIPIGLITSIILL